MPSWLKQKVERQKAGQRVHFGVRDHGSDIMERVSKRPKLSTDFELQERTLGMDEQQVGREQDKNDQIASTMKCG